VNFDNILSSHLICTHPGESKKDHGWYHFLTVLGSEHKTSSQRWSTCSLQRQDIRQSMSCFAVSNSWNYTNHLETGRLTVDTHPQLWFFFCFIFICHAVEITFETQALSLSVLDNAYEIKNKQTTRLS